MRSTATPLASVNCITCGSTNRTSAPSPRRRCTTSAAGEFLASRTSGLNETPTTTILLPSGIAGYGGGFVSIDDAPAGGGSIMTVYVPYAFDGKGVPSKALAITLDTTPGSESVVVAHASGAAVVMTHTGELVLRSDTGEARIVLKGDTITLQAAKVVAQGNVVLGANPIGAVPLAAPGAMSPSVFVSAV